MTWEKVKNKKGTYYKSGVFRISQIDRHSYSLISVEQISFGKGNAFLAYICRTLEEAKQEAALYEAR